MIHGSFGCGADWREIASRLDRPSYAPDLPGHGTRPATPAASFSATVDELVGILPTGCDLVGYSLGGRLALAAALRAPRGTVRSLVLESAHPGLEPKAQRARLDEDRARAERLERDPEDFLREFYSAPLFATFREHDAFEAVLAERIARAQREPAALAATLVALSPGNQPQLANELIASAIPTMLVAGEKDQKYATLARDLLAADPAGRLRLAVVPDAGHNVHFEKPDDFVAVLTEFQEELA